MASATIQATGQGPSDGKSLDMYAVTVDAATAAKLMQQGYNITNSNSSTATP